MDKETSEKIREQEKEIEFLRAEIARLKTALSKSADSVEDMLLRRGFRIYRKRPERGLIKPRPATRKALDEFYRWMKRYSFRLFLRDVIKHKDGFRPEELVRYSSLAVVEEFCGYLAKAGILSEPGRGCFRLEAGDIKSFGPTLEWFVSETLTREYLSDSVWGVKFKDTASGGDYDVIAALEGRLLYAEVKSSPPKQIYSAEVGAFIARIAELGPDVSLFIVDTELRMKDKVVALFEEVMPDTVLSGLPVARLKDELFHVDGRLFIVNSKDSLTANIGEVLGWYLRRS